MQKGWQFFLSWNTSQIYSGVILQNSESSKVGRVEDWEAVETTWSEMARKEVEMTWSENSIFNIASMYILNYTHFN